MIRGLISGLTAMRAQVLNQEVIGNNLANSNTTAFSKDRVTFSSFNDVLMYRLEQGRFPSSIGCFSGGTVVHRVETDRSAGPMEITGEPLDIALQPGDYLKVQTDSGVRYTRRGDLKVSFDGFVTAGGYKILGRSGNPIYAGEAVSCRIAENGVVTALDREVDALDVVTAGQGTAPVREGDSLFQIDPRDLERQVFPRVTVGALEQSSVDPVSEMVSLIIAMRAYEAAQKAVRAHDETLDHAVNRVGRV